VSSARSESSLSLSYVQFGYESLNLSFWSNFGRTVSQFENLPGISGMEKRPDQDFIRLTEKLCQPDL
jgi:hypothetical protein